MAPPGTQAPSKRGGAPPPSRPPRKRQRVDMTRSFSQKTSQAFPQGNVTTDNFVKARATNVEAMEKAIAAAKDKLSARAHQELPRELRRRIASHDPKRVPKRLRRRARKEMAEDNTPARKKKSTGKMRLRLDTAELLKQLGKKAARENAAKKKLVQEKASGDAMDIDTADVKAGSQGENAQSDGAVVKTRKPKIKAQLAEPPPPPKKFQKRQINKTWLPTHMWHTKRAHMTEPKDPLWRFAIPLSPSQKCYRPTHRASALRGAVAWDTSYMSTIGLEGPEKSVEGLLKALGVGAHGDPEGLWGKKGQKWRNGSRKWDGWLYERQESPMKAIAPATVIWSPIESSAQSNGTASEGKTSSRPAKRKVFVRVHPAGFLQLWEQVIRLAKVQKPEVSVEDLRFEIGSIEITGPLSTEALVSILWPAVTNGETLSENSPEAIWKHLVGLNNCSALPKDVVLAFDCVDPRLHHPPRRPSSSQDAQSQTRLLNILAEWPVDSTLSKSPLFDRKARNTAVHYLPSQKSINRRKALVKGNGYPEPRSTDPKIPVLLYTSRNAVTKAQGTWTLMLPWKCVLPVWYSVMYYPVATGGSIRLGGLQEKRQLAFESSQPWFPADLPGTRAGNYWEARSSEKRKREWEKMPKSKRVEWTTLNLGGGRIGEIGIGWACDWKRLVQGPEANPEADNTPQPLEIHSLPTGVALKILRSPSERKDELLKGGLATVKITMVGRGVPAECARVYRLPTTDKELRKKWLTQFQLEQDLHTKANKKPYFLPPPSKDAPIDQQAARQAYLLLNPPEPSKPGDEDYPIVPDEMDLIGFVTTGNFNLSEGRATGVGSLLLERVISNDEGSRKKSEDSLCIVRKAGEKIGRLGRWEII